MKQAFTFILVTLVAACLAFPGGPPQSACNNRIPKHTGTNKHGAGIYKLTTRSKNGKIEVILDGGLFKGFMITGSGDPNGFFEADTTHGQMTCQSDLDTFHHLNPDTRSRITAIWNGNPNTIFNATVVKDFQNYYSGIEA